jgi:hypothetical protein
MAMSATLLLSLGALGFLRDTWLSEKGQSLKLKPESWKKILTNPILSKTDPTEIAAGRGKDVSWSCHA